LLATRSPNRRSAGEGPLKARSQQNEDAGTPHILAQQPPEKNKHRCRDGGRNEAMYKEHNRAAIVIVQYLFAVQPSVERRTDGQHDKRQDQRRTRRGQQPPGEA